MSLPRVLAEVNDYEGLVAALRLRVAERKIAIGDDFTHEVMGLPSGYLSKLLGPNPIKRLGMISLAPVLAVAGVKLIIVEDLDAIARYGARLRERNEALVRSGASHPAVEFRVTIRRLKKLGALGGAKRSANMSPGERKKSARKAAKARWAKRRREHRIGPKIIKIEEAAE